MRLLAFVVLALFAVTKPEEGATLLVSKSLLNRYAVEGRDLTLQYNMLAQQKRHVHFYVVQGFE
uniref:Uncharacterized protein n=1 Tax=Prolemur simus TaxID=1328070 RepID=A0A8C9AIJ2_PROSS